jgi:hypothetical protein
VHNVVRQVRNLAQTLSQAKRPLGFLISAGCPMSITTDHGGTKRPLIPDIAGLTVAVETVMLGGSGKDAYETITKQLGDDGRTDWNVEDVLSHVRGLRQAAGTGVVRGVTAAVLDDLDRRICEAIVGVVSVSLPAVDTPYHKLAAWAGGISRTYPVELFTTNYDLLLEEGLETIRVPYFDGFIGSRRTFFDPYAIEEDPLPPRWARVWKVHGSVNWRQDPSGLVSRGESVSGTERRVIHPSHLKYDESRKMPYLAMLERLARCVKQSAAALVTCGYSFRDDHINATLLQALEGNPTAVCFALLYGPLNSYGKAIDAATRRANLTVLAADEAIIGTKRGCWLGQPPDEAIQVTGVAWKDVAGSSNKDAVFTLGDFATFGGFLSELVGEVTSRAGAGDGA